MTGSKIAGTLSVIINLEWKIYQTKTLCSQKDNDSPTSPCNRGRKWINLKLWKLVFSEWRGNVNIVQGQGNNWSLVERVEWMHSQKCIKWNDLVNGFCWFGNIETFLHLTCGFNHSLRWLLDCRSVYLQLACGFNHRWFEWRRCSKKPLRAK